MSKNYDIDRLAEAAPDLLKALEKIASYSKDNNVEEVFNRMGWRMQEIAEKAVKPFLTENSGA